MVTISSRAATIASGEGVCARTGVTANNTVRHTISVHEHLRMKGGTRDGIIAWLRRSAVSAHAGLINREASVLDQLAVARVIAADARQKVGRRGDVGLTGSG